MLAPSTPPWLTLLLLLRACCCCWAEVAARQRNKRGSWREGVLGERAEGGVGQGSGGGRECWKMGERGGGDW